PKGTPPVAAAPQGQTTPARGTLSFVNNTVDPTTGTIQLKATFENANNSLWPGQFATVPLRLRRETRAIVGPPRGNPERSAGAVRLRGQARRDGRVAAGGDRLRQRADHRDPPGAAGG